MTMALTYDLGPVLCLVVDTISGTERLAELDLFITSSGDKDAVPVYNTNLD
jgi:hypothetical protein